MIEPTITRRAVLRGGAAAVALASLPLRILDAVDGMAASSTATNTWTFSQWSGLVGATFTVSLPDGSAARLRLADATNMMPAGSSTTSGPQNFSLTFTGGLTPQLGQATQTLSNKQIGAVQMFMVPGSVSASARSYLAIVNRI